MKITLKDQKRTGVFAEHKHLRFEAGGLRTDMRMTIPAREAIQRVSQLRDDAYYYQSPPTGIVIVLAPIIEHGAPTGGYMPALRMADEPAYPGEMPNQDMWLQVEMTPCPKCGAALVWYEAGYVPGYRVCAGTQHHHYIATT